MLRNLVLGAVSSLALVSAASAADMYVPGPAGPGGYKDAPYFYNWTGFYAGVNGGYGWGAASSVHEQEYLGGVLTAEASTDFTPSGGFGGAQIGYNWQRDRFVYGLEADIQGADIDGDATATLDPTHWAHGSTNLDWFGTIRGRLGVTIVDRGLLYATGGFAFGGIHDKLTKADPAIASVSDSKTATGYVLGGGFEYAFSPKWSAKVEYQFIDLGKDTLAVDVAVNPVYWGVLNADHQYNTVRVGVNYHFFPAYEPLK